MSDNTPETPTVATRLARLAHDRGVSARELARRTGMGRGQVQRRLAGLTRIQADELPELARALNVPTTALLDTDPTGGVTTR